MAEHLNWGYRETGAYGDWQNPVDSIPVTSADLNATRTYNRFEDTGSIGKSRRYASPLGVDGSGNISMRAYPIGLFPWLFRSVLMNSTAEVNGIGWDNHMLPADNDLSKIQPGWFSIQKAYSPGQRTEFVRGVALSSLTLSATGGEEANVSADVIVQDTGHGSTGWSDGASTPSSQSVSYPAPLPDPLRFDEGRIFLGGTPTLSGNNEILLSGSEETITFESFSLTMNFNAEGRFAIRNGPPTFAYTRNGEREIEFTGDIDWSNYPQTYYTRMKAATRAAIQLNFTGNEYGGGINYRLKLNLPYAVYQEDSANYPTLDGSHTPKLQTVNLVAMEHPTIQTDIGVSFRTLENMA